MDGRENGQTGDGHTEDGQTVDGQTEDRQTDNGGQRTDRQITEDRGPTCGRLADFS